MRIVIDMQGAQTTGSRFRGIGRYTMSLTQAMVRNRGEHEIILALNGLFPESIEPIRAAFDGLLPQENIRVWNALAPVAAIDAVNDWRRQSAELIREAFLASLKPDVVHVSSLFEGLGDDAVTSVGAFTRSAPTTVTLYDLIPYVHRSPYLENPVVEAWYLKKIESLRRADLWLAISESSRQEGVVCLGLPEARSINVSTDADAQFQKIKISPESERTIRRKYGLHRPFVMYTGGIDHRKNVEGLIRAYSELPTRLRENHQLAIVCSVQPENRRLLEKLAAQQGLMADEVVLTGFVPEDDLLAFYNLCTLFVFPSWHEGFGLPVLEAMRCGVPVMGSNTSSLPEIIGLDEALFNPYSDTSIAQAMKRALSDDAFRSRLIEHGAGQSARFSWDESAKRAIAAMEQLVAERRRQGTIQPSDAMQRPKLAYVSPLPPERSGIADYSAELLPALAKYYEIEVIVAQDGISDPWINAHCPIRTVSWFVEHAARYERVLYHFGNSAFHQHMFELLKSIPGVVVLHDFFLSGVLHHMEATGFAPGVWTDELYHSHGYGALQDRFLAKTVEASIWKYPCSLGVIQNSLGMIAHSPHTLRLARQWYGGAEQNCAIIPLMRDSRINATREQSRCALGYKPDDFLVCTFGMMGPTKLNHRLLEAWLRSRLAKTEHCHLVFVGDHHPDDYGNELLATIQKSQSSRNIRITGWADTVLFRQYLAAADVGVQLRTLSRGETSGTALDCMNYGLATIVNANGSMADLDGRAAWKLPDEFTDEELIVALETLWLDEKRRCQMGESARRIIIEDHRPEVCAKLYHEAIERFFDGGNAGLQGLVQAIAKVPEYETNNEINKTALISLAGAIAKNFPLKPHKKQLLVDVSDLVQRDSKTSIQRVVRSILKEWLRQPPTGYRVEPVYATVEQAYRYARQFTQRFLGTNEGALTDEPIDYAPGDIFFGLDLQPQVIPAQQAFFQAMRRQGVQVRFAVYDLLPVRMPQYFIPGASDAFTRWLEVVAESDGALCISKAVADELAEWVKENAAPRRRPFKIDAFALGADVNGSPPTTGLPEGTENVFGNLRQRPSFLMVGTLEPRKAHTQVLEAFEQLWQNGADINLVIVGKQGWLVETLVDKLRAHPECNKRLYWLEGVSDEYLVKIYAASTCLIAASYGEGFGLPLIEAAQHKLPIIARDIPVFREVAGENAYYFEGNQPEHLAQSIKAWLGLYQHDCHPKSGDMRWLTWNESAHLLIIKIQTENNSRNNCDEQVHTE